MDVITIVSKETKEPLMIIENDNITITETLRKKRKKRKDEIEEDAKD